MRRGRHGAVLAQHRGNWKREIHKRFPTVARTTALRARHSRQTNPTEKFRHLIWAFTLVSLHRHRFHFRRVRGSQRVSVGAFVLYRVFELTLDLVRGDVSRQTRRRRERARRTTHVCRRARTVVRLPLSIARVLGLLLSFRFARTARTTLLVPLGSPTRDDDVPIAVVVAAPRCIHPSVRRRRSSARDERIAVVHQETWRRTRSPVSTAHAPRARGRIWNSVFARRVLLPSRCHHAPHPNQISTAAQLFPQSI